jgi:benzoyl-CoA reductase subunit A
MLRAGAKEGDVLASYLFAIAYRLYTLVGRMKIENEVAFTGGLAKNPGVAKRLERELKVTVATPKYDPQLAAAIGAAISAR